MRLGLAGAVAVGIVDVREAGQEVVGRRRVAEAPVWWTRRSAGVIVESG